MSSEASANSWQLKMFQKTLKKKMRLSALKRHIGPLGPEDRCLLVTCGDNNGAMNYYLRQHGGCWSWAELESKSIPEMSELLGESVLHVLHDKLPFSDEQFDCTVSIDVHEHLPEMAVFTRELQRVTRQGGKVVITVPNGDTNKWVTRLKNHVGMTMEKYGHYRVGLNVAELKALMTAHGIKPMAASTFSRFFTELLELIINYVYVMILSTKSEARVEQGTIAPATRAELKSVEKSYRMYALVYPLFNAISKLDILQFATHGYVVMVEGRKE